MRRLRNWVASILYWLSNITWKLAERMVPKLSPKDFRAKLEAHVADHRRRMMMDDDLVSTQDQMEHLRAHLERCNYEPGLAARSGPTSGTSTRSRSRAARR